MEKVKLIERRLPPESISVSALSKETGISKSTLQTWKPIAVHPKNTWKKVITPKDKFLTVMETYLLSEAELARYCREKGLFVEYVKKWHNAYLYSTSGNVDSDDVKELKLKQQEDAKRIKASNPAFSIASLFRYIGPCTCPYLLRTSFGNMPCQNIQLLW